MSESVRAKIHAAAARNTELLATLKQTDYALPALAQHNAHIAELEREIKSLEKQIAKLETNRKDEHKEHVKYRDSVMKRFAYKVARKTERFEEKASKEERDYFEALQAEQNAKETRGSLAHQLSQAHEIRQQLEATAAQHRQAQKDLDTLYDGIFQGHTPGFPEEDLCEKESEVALSTYHVTRMQVQAEDQVVKTLGLAVVKMKAAMTHLDDARHHSRMDMFGGGTLSDMMERSALQKGEQCSMEAQMLIMQAQKLSPHVKDVPRPTIAQGNLMSDVFFDNLYSDMAFHDKIRQSQVDVQQCAKRMAEETEQAKLRLEQLNAKLHGEEKRLEQARAALQKAREDAFAGTTPPSYHHANMTT